jgi:hypothetical protein
MRIAHRRTTDERADWCALRLEIEWPKEASMRATRRVMGIGLAAAVAVSGACATTNAAGTNGQAPPPSPPTQVSSSQPNVIPVGQEIDVRLQATLSSETANVEDRFQATTAVDLMQDGATLVPAGSLVRGLVRSVDRASRTDRTGQLTLAFDELTVNGRAYPMQANAVQAFESSGLRGELERIGVGAGAGAIIGGIIGGLEGALVGVLIGTGGVIAATEGKDVELPAGTILRIRMDSPVTIRR